MNTSPSLCVVCTLCTIVRMAMRIVMIVTSTIVIKVNTYYSILYTYIETWDRYRRGYVNVHNHAQALFSLYIHIHSMIFYMHHQLLLPPGSCPSQAGGGKGVYRNILGDPYHHRAWVCHPHVQMRVNCVGWSETLVGYASDLQQICLHLNEVPQVQP